MLRFFGILISSLALMYVLDVIILQEDITKNDIYIMAAFAAFYTLISYLKDILERLDDIEAQHSDVHFNDEKD